jgi:uncharacterized repeat protein (TIGR03803 family)
VEELEPRWLPSVSQVAFLTPPQTLTAGQSAALITIQLEDSSSNAATAASDTTFSLSTTSTMGSFRDSSGKALSGNSITIPAGSSSTGFEYFDSSTGTPTLTAAGGGFSATQQETVNPASVQLDTLYSFNSNAVNPNGNLIEDSGGNLFGTSRSGGANGIGSVFELAKGSSTITTLASFDFSSSGGFPGAGLIQDSSGNLFGTTSSFGPDLNGSVFELDRGSSTITTLASFNGTIDTGGSAGGFIENSHGNLFGTTLGGGTAGYGTVFELAKGSSTITTLASFNNTNGANPQSALITDASGNLFGTASSGGTQGDGTVFELAQGSNTITVLASFNGTNGADPVAGLIQDTSGNLFGTTNSGGTDNDGTLFELAKGSHTITTLVSFNGANGADPAGGLIEDTGGNLFGTTASGGTASDGTLFELARGSNTITTLASFTGTTGANPRARLIEDSSGDLFGTTSNGGTAGNGTVFELAKGNSAITTLASCNATSGSNPEGSLVEDSSGNLFGTTPNGGTSGNGTLFQLTRGSKTITTLSSFTVDVGVEPQTGLIIDGSGNLFGTTFSGGPGTSFDGTIFKVARGSSTITTLASFTNSTPGSPVAESMIEDSQGNFFGTAEQAGKTSDGSVFEVAKGSTTIRTLAFFNFNNGSEPQSGLVEYMSGNLFGTTRFGGTDGTVFELPKGSSTIRTLASFDGSNGSQPQAGLIADSSGNLFGTTSGGGPANDGTVFEVAHGSHTITTLASFNGANGASPQAVLMEDRNGNLFGTTTAGGPAGDGTVFELAKGSSTISTLASFNGANGARPQAALIMDSSGNLFGSTYQGGTSNSGTLFEIVPAVVAQLAFTTAPQTLAAGATGTLTVQLQNQFGASIAASAPVTVNLTSSSSGGVFLIGGNPVTIVTIPAGSVGITFQYKDTMAGTPTLTASAAGVSSAVQQETVTAVATSLVFGVQPSGAIAGMAISPAVTVEVLDQNGNLLATDNTDQVTLSVASGPGAFAGGNTVTATVSGGIATFGNLIFPTAGSYTLGESAAGGLRGPNSNSFTIAPVTMNHLVFSVQPTNTPAGSAVAPAVQVEVLDQNNSPVTTDNSDQITLTVASGPGSIASGGTATVSGGVATFSNLILDTAGSYTLNESGTGNLSGANSSSFTVSALGGDHLLFGTQPGTTTAGIAINPAVTVEVVDKFGNLIAADSSDQVTVSVASGPGTFTSSPPPVAVNGGIASFGNLTLDTAGSYTLGAATSGLTGATSTSFSVTAASADHLAYSAQPGTTTAGTPIAAAMKAEVLDKFGNLITADNSDMVTVSLATKPAGGAFTSSSTTTVTVSGGIATFSDLVIDIAGSYTLAVSTTGGVTGPNSAVFTINPAGIGQLFFSVQPGSAPAGSTIGPAVQVEVFDAFGNTLTADNKDTVTLTVNNAGRGPSVFNDGSGTTSAMVSAGVATFNNLVIDAAGTYTLAASTTGVTGAPSSPFLITSALVSSFVVVSSHSGETAGNGFNVSIRARDIFGNTISEYDSSNTVKLTSSDGQRVAPSSVTLNNGRANPLVTLSTPGSVHLTATATVNGVTIRGTSAAITVLPGMQNVPGPGTAPTEYTATLYVTGSSAGAANVLGLAVVADDAAAASSDGVDVSVIENFGTAAQNDAAAQTFFANQESILQQQDNLATGAVITTVDPQSGSNTVMETPVGQDNSVPVSFPPIITRVTGPGTPSSLAAFSMAFPEGVNGVNSVADTPDPVTVTALDVNSNVITSYTGTITLSSTDPQFGQPITYTFTSADQGSHTFYVYLNTEGIQSLMVALSTQSGQAVGNAQAGPLASGSGRVMGQGLVNVMADTVDSLILDVPSTMTAGSKEGFTLTALDALGNVATGYTGTVSFLYNSTTSITGLPGSYTFTAADKGSHLFPVSFKTTGSLAMIASDAADFLVSQQVDAQIIAGPAKLAIMTQPPTTVTAGNNFGLAFEAMDSHGKVDSNFNGLVTVTLATNPVNGKLGGVITVQAVNGIATFSGLTLNKAGGGYSLKASSGTVTAATTRAIRVTANTASQFVAIAHPPSKFGAGGPFSIQMTAEDGYGNVVSTLRGNVTLTLASGPSGAELDGKMTATLVKGVATFTGLRIRQAGTGYSLTASGSLSAVTTDPFDVTAQTGAFAVAERNDNAKLNGSRQE